VFQTASGITIPFPEKIKEEFQIFERSIRFNLSFEKIRPMLDEFLEQLQEPLFFVLELPLTQQEESELRKSDTDPLHKKVCYLDGQSKKQVQTILQNYGELLLNDGLSQFAVASHITKDEMFIQKYKLIDIYCEEPAKYFDLLKKYSLNETDSLLTVWDTFSRETPGEARRVEMNGLSVFDVYDELVKLGLYDAKVIEE
jgi:hypothetical protein